MTEVQKRTHLTWMIISIVSVILVVLVSVVSITNNSGKNLKSELPSSTEGLTISCTAGNGVVHIYWNNKFNGYSGPTLYRDNVAIVYSNSNNYIDRNVINGTTYSYFVDVYDAGFPPDYKRSETVSCTPNVSVNTPIPAIPTNLTCTPGVNLVTINMDATPNTEWYELKATRQGDTYSRTLESTDNIIMDYANDTYDTDYKVKAIGISGSSDWSTSIRCHATGGSTPTDLGLWFPNGNTYDMQAAVGQSIHVYAFAEGEKRFDWYSKMVPSTQGCPSAYTQDDNKRRDASAAMDYTVPAYGSKLCIGVYASSTHADGGKWTGPVTGILYPTPPPAPVDPRKKTGTLQR